MDTEVFKVLDKAVEQGGTKIAAKDLAEGKTARSLIDRLCKEKLLKKEGSKYTMTPEGRARWEKDAPLERLQEVKGKEDQVKREAVIAFLELVVKKENKKLTAAELKKHGPMPQEALDKKLVAPGEAENSFHLLPGGTAVLQARLPLAEQIERLREARQELIDRWSATHVRLRDELGTLSLVESDPVDDIASEVQTRGQQALTSFDATVTELEAFPHLLKAGQALRDALLNIQKTTLTRLDALNEQQQVVAQIESIKEHAQESLAKQQAELTAFLKQTDEQLEALRQFPPLAGKEKPATPHPVATKAHPEPSEDAVWQATQKAAEQLRQTRLAMGGVVKVPELTDAVQAAVPGLSAVYFHRCLKKWQSEDQLVLQVCNDPRLEERAAEGIESERGLLFYVRLREPKR